MQIVEPTDHHEHKWLEWTGLEQPPAQADTWEPIARGFFVDDPASNTSRGAGALVAVLKQAGVDAQQRSYQFDTTMGFSYLLPSGGEKETHVAVGVHNRDRERATELARKFMEEQDRYEEAELSVSDEELTRQALEAAPEPD